MYKRDRGQGDLPACVMAMRWRVEDSEGGRTAMRSSGFTRDLSAVLGRKGGKEKGREGG